MPVFTFDARNGTGTRQRGQQEAASAGELASDLRKRGMLVISIQPVTSTRNRSLGAALNPFAWLPPNSSDIAWSLQQMAVMLRSGMTLLTSLRTMAEYARRPAMRDVWNAVAERIQQGSGLADAMAQHRCFNSMVLQLVRVGELTGTLDQVVGRASETLERRRQLRSQIITALAYPTIVLISAIGVSVFMIVGVIPKLRVFLEALGRRLPPLTQLLLDISAFFQSYGVQILIGILALTVGAITLYLLPPSRLVIDRWLLRLPILGTWILRVSATAQFSYALGTMLQSGVTLVEGLRTVQTLHRNRYLAGIVAESREAILRGSGLAPTLAEPGSYMPMLSRMVAVGESAGTLQEILMEVARFHENQLQSTIRWLSTIIEPVIVVVVGGIVGFVYISFFVAMFSVAGGAR